MKKKIKQTRKFIFKKYNWLKVQVKRRPMLSFFAGLGFLLLVLIVVRVLGAPKPAEELAQLEPKLVETYTIGSVPTITVQAKIDKAGVVTIVSQTAGIVSQINAYEGEEVYRGQNLVSLGSTYTGANAASLSRQIAQKNLTHSQETLQANLDLIQKRRALAEQTDENADKQRELAEDTLSRTKDQLSLNEDILSIIEKNLADLEASSPASESAILSLKQLKGQYLAAVNNLKDGVASLEYANDTDNPPTKLSDLGKEISLKGLELEEKGLKLSLEIFELNLKLAQVNELMFYPQAPFAGVVERVFVKPGQFVSPGTPLMAIAGNKQTMKAVALVSQEVAQKVSRFEPSTLFWDDQQIEQIPQYVATEPTDGNLFAITWCDLADYTDQLANKEYLGVKLPVGYPDSIAAMPFLPLDAIYQTQEEAYVFVMTPAQDNQNVGTVTSRTVELGEVYGNFVQIKSGVQANDIIILDRTVFSGDRVKNG